MCQLSLPSILPSYCVTIGWVVDETDVDSNQRCSIRSHNLSTNDTGVAVLKKGRPHTVTMTTYFSYRDKKLQQYEQIQSKNSSPGGLLCCLFNICKLGWLAVKLKIHTSKYGCYQNEILYTIKTTELRERKQPNTS